MRPDLGSQVDFTYTNGKKMHRWRVILRDIGINVIFLFDFLGFLKIINRNSRF
jgi:hypothetical protein